MARLEFVSASGISYNPQMDQELITLWVYRDLPEALVAKTKLESAEIDCFLADENVVCMNWFWSNAVGGVKLQVEPQDSEPGLEILADPIPVALTFDDEGTEYHQPQCPKCGSLDVSFESINKFSLVTLYALSLPIPFPKNAWKCEDCWSEW